MIATRVPFSAVEPEPLVSVIIPVYQGEVSKRLADDALAAASTGRIAGYSCCFLSTLPREQRPLRDPTDGPNCRRLRHRRAERGTEPAPARLP